MKMKKIVSAFAALAMAASSFAAMTITASAAVAPVQIYSLATGPSATNNTRTSDISTALAGLSEDATDIRIAYTVTTSVDFSNGNGRSGTATVTGKNSSGEDMVVLSIFANTTRDSGYRRYSLDSVANNTSTLFDDSRDNSTSHQFDVELNISLANNTISGTISKMDDPPAVTTINETPIDLKSLSSIDCVSSSSANTMAVSNFVVYEMQEVEAIVPANITISGDETFYNNVGTKTYTATVISNTEEVMSDETVTWSLDNIVPTANYSSNGLAIGATTGVLTVPATFAGTANVVATSDTDDSVTAILPITIEPAPVLDDIIISGSDSVEYADGKKIQLFAATVDQYGNPYTGTVKWSSNNNGIATIDETTGVVTLISTGDVTFTATADSNNGVTSTKTVHVLVKPERDDELDLANETYTDMDGTYLVRQTDTTGTIEAYSGNGITYAQGGRNNGGNTTQMSVVEGRAQILLGNPASASRVPRMTFDNAINLADIISINSAAQNLEFDLNFTDSSHGTAYDKVRIYDGTSVGSSGYETTVSTVIATIENTENGLFLNDANTGLDASGDLHIKVVLDGNAAYIEVTDAQGITYAAFGTKTDKIGGIVFGNNSGSAKYFYIDNVRYYINGVIPKIEFTSQAEFEVQSEEHEDQDEGTGTLRFLTKVDYENLTPGSFGYYFINFADDYDYENGAIAPNTVGEITVSATEIGTEIESGQSFYYDIYEIEQSTIGVGFYAVPYFIAADKDAVLGSPFTYAENFWD